MRVLRNGDKVGYVAKRAGTTRTIHYRFFVFAMAQKRRSKRSRGYSTSETAPPRNTHAR